MYSKAEKILKAGGIGVLPTDTIYGIVGRAELPATVERIYHVRGRRPDKPMIILIGAIDDLRKFGISPTQELKTHLAKYWPGKVTIVLPLNNEKFAYLHRGTDSLAFRLPDNSELAKLINKTGPLVAPSANPEGLAPARTVAEAHEYFGDSVDFYIDGGAIDGTPSKIIKIEDGRETIIRS